MILLYIYIGTILFSLLSLGVYTICVVSEYNQRFTKEERKLLSKNKAKREASPLVLPVSLLLPIWNIIMGFVAIFCYRSAADNYLEKCENRLKEIRENQEMKNKV